MQDFPDNDIDDQDELDAFFKLNDPSAPIQEIELPELGEKQRKVKLKSLVQDLSSDNPVKVKKAISAINVYGDESIIEPCADALLKNLDLEIEENILYLLASIKSTKVIAPLMNAIADVRYYPVRRQLISSIWNMKVDFSDHLSTFVQLAVEGDFMVALECLTVIENLNGPFEEEEVLEAQVALKNYAEASFAKDEKAHLISEIAIIIKDIDRNLGEGLDED
jgi:hypothetical protein